MCEVQGQKDECNSYCPLRDKSLLHEEEKEIKQQDLCHKAVVGEMKES